MSPCIGCERAKQGCGSYRNQCDKWKQFEIEKQKRYAAAELKSKTIVFRKGDKK